MGHDGYGGRPLPSPKNKWLELKKRVGQDGSKRVF